MQGFIDRLRSRLAGRLPGEAAQFRMAPVTRLRMHEALKDAAQWRHGAVLVYLFPGQGDWRTVLMKRPEYDGAHGGQISIPGGALEPGEDHAQAALREFAEETGVRVAREQLLGGLSELFIPTSRFLVKPFVAHGAQRPIFQPDAIEVEAIIELTIPALLSHESVRQGRVRLGPDSWVETPYFEVDGHRVWGATAMILSEFRELLRELR
jgi:8-oxo-dGTP pyrophosphatase MutT (NUDIX family)